MAEGIVVHKNSRESIVIKETNYNGHELIDIRTFYKGENDELLPTKKGVTFKADKLENFIASLSSLSQEITMRGDA